MDGATLPPSSVLEQLEKIVASGAFRGAGRSIKLLRFLVEQTLNGNASHLKDYTLGAEVFERGEAFDPRSDPIARVEASRLRSRLELYYATEGGSDPILITVPKGGYVPVFERRQPPLEKLSAASGSGSRLTWVALALVGAAALFASLSVWRTAADAPGAPELRLEITTPPTTDPVSLAISPDGQKIVFVASAEGVARLWLRFLNSTSARPLPGTEHASLPFWSPDSASVGFFADSKVKRIDTDSGVVRVLNRALVPAGGTWSQEGLIIHPTIPDSPLFTVTADGGNSTPLTTLSSEQTGHRAPQFLPDGRHYIYYAMGSPKVRGIYVGEIGATNSRRLIDSDTPAVYAATGHLLYVNQRTLFAQRFDPARLELAGDPQPVAEEVTSGERANIAALSASAAGPIAYRTGSPGGKRLFVWFDRSGREIGTVGPGEGFGPSYASLSPDGRRLALQRTDAGNTDIWLLDLQRNTPVRFTSEPEAEIAPLWSPSGDRIVFSSRRTGVFNLHQQAVTEKASQEALLTEQSKQATDWSRDGRFLLFRSFDPEWDWDIWAMRVGEEGNGKPFPVVRSKFEERDAQFSPDGKWIAYQSNESGRFEIYVQPFQDSGERLRISINGGVQPRWRRDGRELFYVALDGQLVAVPVALSSSNRSLEAGAAVLLFHARVGAVQDISLPDYIVSPDGQRFLLDTVVEEAAAPIVVILNWKPRLQ